MEGFLVYLLLGILVFLVNLAPALMPPTWSILAFFTIRNDLDIIPTVIVGATAAASGRIMLYCLSARFAHRFLSEKRKISFNSLGAYLKNYQNFTLPFIFAYAFSPIPSNQLFIIAGLTRFNLPLLAFSFYIGRLISYTFWVGLANSVANNLEGVFTRHLTSVPSLTMELLGFTFLFLVALIDWSKIIPRKYTQETARITPK